MVPTSLSFSTDRMLSIKVAIGLLALSVGLAGCLGPAPTDEPSSGDESSPTAYEATQTTTSSLTDKTSHPNLSSQLSELAAADDPEAYAQRHNISYRNGSVKVLIELKEGRSLPDGYGVEVETRHEEDVVAWAPVGQLGSLADHRNVSFVRQPVEPETYNLNK